MKIRMKMPSVGFSLFIFGILTSLSVITCQNYNTFLQKHIVEDKESINCNATIKARNLNSDSCRFRNTFIHDTGAKKVRDLCSPYVTSKVVSSSAALRLTDCKLIKSSLVQSCSYNQMEMRGTVYVTCENRVPVHFVKLQPSFAPSWTLCVWKLVLLILLKDLLLNEM